ncbi:MAG: homoserine kinase [Sphingomonadales bacterium]|nr:homoserine kinase [Sphingomonadales bacterium]
MAVYTQVGAEDAAKLLTRYDVGELVSIKGIAEGVENSNYFVETTHSKFILTLYEKRVDPGDLPFFHALLAHLHTAGCKVPRFIDDRDGAWLQQLCGRPACLIEFLSGFSVSTPSAAQAEATGQALAEMHNALADFTMMRPNSLGVSSFRPLAERCGSAALESIAGGLSARIMAECDYVKAHWPAHLPVSAIHADLFPDNVLILDDRVSGLIDFYFACTDVTGYDLAVTHAAWSFSSDGRDYFPEIGRAILTGYEQSRTMDIATREAFPVLARAACLRFLLTRCYDWINTPKSAIVTQKDPLAFLRRLDFYTNSFDKL